MAFFLSRKWNRQPTGPLRIDWNNPLARGLHLAWHGGALYTAATSRGYAGPRLGNDVATWPARSFNRHGTGALISTSSWVQFVLEVAPYIPPPFSVFAAYTGGASGTLFSYQGAGAGQGWKVGNLTGGPVLTFGGVANYAPSVSVGNGNLGFVVTGNGGTARFFVDGLFRDSSAVGTAGNPSAGAYPILPRIGAASTGSAISDVMDANTISRVFVFSRALSDAEAIEVQRNPWQLFHRRIVRVYSPGATPAAPTAVTTSSTSFDRTTVSWTDNSADETGFKVRYAPSPYSSWTTATGSVAASPYTVTGLVDGTSYKAAVAAFNANGDSSWAESGVFTTSALTKLRPSADTTTGSWSASSGAVLYTMIDEANADDADYITTSVNATCKIKLENGTDPASGANHVLRVRARGTGGTLRAELVQSATPETTIASWAITYTASFADFDLSLTTAQADAITDYSALYVKLISS